METEKNFLTKSNAKAMNLMYKLSESNLHFRIKKIDDTFVITVIDDSINIACFLKVNDKFLQKYI